MSKATDYLYCGKHVMDLSVSKAQQPKQRDLTAPAATRPELSSQDARGAFAAALQGANVNFSTGGTLAFAPKALAAHFDRPAQAERPQPARQTMRSDLRSTRTENRAEPRGAQRVEQPKAPRIDRKDDRKVADDEPVSTGAADAAAKRDDQASKASDATASDKANTQTTASTEQASQPAEANQAAAVDSGSMNAAAAAETAVVAMIVAPTAAKAADATAGDDADADVLAGQAGTDQLAQVKGDGGKATDAGKAMDGNQALDTGDDDSESLFALQLKLQAAAEQSRAAAAKANGEAANAKAATDPDAAARDQADLLARSLDDRSRLDVKVTTGEGRDQALPQTGGSLVQGVALLGDTAGNGFGADTGAQSNTGRDGSAQGNGPRVLDQALGQTGADGAVEAQGPQQSPTATFADTMKAAAGAAVAETAAAGQKVQGGSHSGDANPQIGGVQGAAQTSQASGAQASSQPQQARPVLPQQQPIVEQIKVDITKAVSEGTDRISIQLKPEALGRIEVKLDVGQNGQVHATVTAENPQTLEMLKQDARGLEKALSDAGLNTDAGSLSFNLRGDGADQQAFARENGGNGRGNGGGGAERQTADIEDARLTAQLTATQLASARGGVDVRI